MVLLSSETRRYTSYGKRRVNGGSSTATRHAQWLEMMGKPATANNNTDNHDNDDDEPSTLPLPASSAFVTPRELPDQNKPTLAKESQRQRVISLSSSENGSASSSSSSSDVHIIPAELARKPIARAKKLRVVESPVSSPPQASSKKEHMAVIKARRPALMARKDSNNIPPSSSPIKKGKEPAKMKDADVHTVEEKENSRPVAQPALPKPVQARPTATSTLSYLTPNVPLHSTPARPHVSQRNSTTTSTSISSSNYLLNRPMALPPPRGHGQHADVAWRRPLTPLVHSNRYGANRNDKRPKQVEKQVKEKPKRPPREREPVSPIAVSKRPTATAAVPVATKRKSIIEVVISRSRTPSPQAVPLPGKSSTQQSTKDSTSSKTSGRNRVIDLSAELDNDISIQVINSRGAPPESASQEEVERGVSVQDPRAASNSGKEPGIFVPEDVKSLLQACSPYSDKIHNFSSVIDRFPLLPSHTAVHAPTWTKLGEATYSEVFVVSTAPDSEEQGALEEIVVKVIPIYQRSSGHDSNAAAEQDLPQTSLIQDVVREVEITRLLSKGTDMSDEGNVSGFTHLRGAYLASGQYPTRLLSAWDDFSKSHSDKGENARPDVFPDTQLYLLLCLCHGGTDLESFRVRNWVQACSILHQVATSLSHAESETQFEHRDLHWGNILIKQIEESTGEVETGGELLPDCLRSTIRDVTATIIDFTLSRATLEDGRILSGGLEDEALFDGEGDQQYECYRLMRRLTKGDWQAYCPMTNVVWLQYLALKLLNDKKLKKPVRKAAGPRTRTLASRAVSYAGTPTKLRAGKTTTSAIQDYEMEKAAYASLKAALAILSASIEAALAAVEATNGAGKPKRKSRAAKMSASSQENEDGASAQVCASAGEFVLWWTHG